MRHLRSAFQKLEQLVINGTAGSPFSDANSFPGMTDYLGTLATDGVTGLGGTTNLTSVYLVRSADPMDTAALILGNDGNITVAPAVRQRVPGATGHYHAWAVEICSWYCYQHASKWTAHRLCNIDSQAATPAVTDDAIAAAISWFPSDRQPTHVLMNRASLKQLRESRTATNATGAPAPFPTEVHGFPIVTTDQISNDETAVA